MSRSVPEFDAFADDYERLLDDPLRRQFAGDAAFFIHQKCRALLRLLERDAPRSHPPRVLDVGCGRGTALEFLKSRCEVIGVDVSERMLRAAVPIAPVAVQEPLALPFESNIFDAAFAFCVYHHIDEADRATHLGELARVVRPGGLVAVFEHNPLNPVTRRVFNRVPIDEGCRMIGRRSLERLFDRVGLSRREHGYVLFVPEFLSAWLGFLEAGLCWLPLGGQYYVAGRKGVPS